MNEGFIFLHRRLLPHPLWTRERFTQGQAWVDLLLMASYADHPVLLGTKVVQVKRGDVLTSQVKLASRWRWNRRTVRVFFRAIVKLGMVLIQTSKESKTGYTLISIINYGTYQGTPTKESVALSPSECPSKNVPDYPSSAHPVPTLNKGNKKEGGETVMKPLPPRVRGKTPEGWQEAVDFWYQEFQRTRGAAPQFSKAEGNCLKKLLLAHPLPQIKSVMTHLLTRTRLKFIKDGHRYSLRTIVGAWNELWDECSKRAVEEGESVP